MTDPTDTLGVLRLLVSCYPSFQDRLTEGSVTAYAATLADVPVHALHAAVLDHVSENRFFPTVAELRERAFRLMAEGNGNLDGYEAWAQALDFVRAGRGHPIASQSRTWEIPPLIEQAVRQVGGWQHLAQRTITRLTAPGLLRLMTGSGK